MYSAESCLIFKRANAGSPSFSPEYRHLCLNSEEETTSPSKGHLSSGGLVCKSPPEGNTVATVHSKTDQHNDKEF